MKQNISGMFIYQRLLQAVQEISECTQINAEILSVLEYDIFISATGLLEEGYINQSQLDIINKIKSISNDLNSLKTKIADLQKTF